MTDEYYCGSQATAVPVTQPLAGGYVWTAPACWPQAPAGWSPPEGWTPPADWPVPPADWQWWQLYPQPPRSSASFHFVGAVTMAGVFVAYLFASFFLAWSTGPCQSDPGNLGDRLVGAVILGVALLAPALGLARKAYKGGYAWQPWLVVVAGLLLVVAYVNDAVSTVSGCFVTF